jgi:D-amino-acid dehydrogenase
MRVAVLGAGVVGVTTAYYLARAGHEVIVVDRRPGPALEASYANGGQISANHATPWATPSAPWQALRWLGRDDAPLLIRPRFDPALWAWLARFLANCTTTRLRSNVARAVRVAVYSRRQLALLRTDTGIAYDHLTRGILHIFHDRREYEKALPGVALMAEHGCVRRVVDADGCVAIEPALADRHDRLVGGIFSPDDESGDAHLFCRRLAEVCADLGVLFRYDTAVSGLASAGGRIDHVDTTGGPIAADAFVVALGSFSSPILGRLGIRLPVYPGKGYSVTLPVAADGVAPTVSLIDDEVKMVYSRLGDRLRVAGTAEFAGYDDSVTEARARFLLAKAMELFPRSGDALSATFWAGLRPSTPDGVPVLGRCGFANLFLNTGHGTLGWTMACGSGRLVADVVGGETPEIAIDDLGIDRFR